MQFVNGHPRVGSYHVPLKPETHLTVKRLLRDAKKGVKDSDTF